MNKINLYIIVARLLHTLFYGLVLFHEYISPFSHIPLYLGIIGFTLIGEYMVRRKIDISWKDIKDEKEYNTIILRPKWYIRVMRISDLTFVVFIFFPDLLLKSLLLIAIFIYLISIFIFFRQQGNKVFTSR